MHFVTEIDIEYVIIVECFIFKHLQLVVATIEDN